MSTDVTRRRSGAPIGNQHARKTGYYSLLHPVSLDEMYADLAIAATAQDFARVRKVYRALVMRDPTRAAYAVARTAKQIERESPEAS